MQDPEEDTQWNDILRSKGILPPKPEAPPEEEVRDIREEESKHELTDGVRKDVEDLTLEELEMVEDAEEEAILEAMRAKRLSELKKEFGTKHFGEPINITAAEYKREVNEAGAKIWVVGF